MPTRNQEIVKQLVEAEFQRQFETQYKNEYKLTCNDIVIDTASNDFLISLLEDFRKNIISALTNPKWVFICGSSSLTREQWLSIQQERLGMKLSTNLKIHTPGTVLPLCQHLKLKPMTPVL